MTDSSSAPAVVSVRRDGDVAIIDLDDGKANALGHETIAALLASLDQVEADGAEAVVLAGRPGLAAGTGHGRGWRCPPPQGTRAVRWSHTARSQTRR